MRRLAAHDAQLLIRILALVGPDDFDQLTAVSKLFARWIAASWRAATLALYPELWLIVEMICCNVFRSVQCALKIYNYNFNDNSTL